MFKIVILSLVAISMLNSCGNRATEPRFVNLRGMVFGSYYSISYYCPQGNNYQTELDSLFKAINRSLSIYDPNSTISRINRNETDIADNHFLEVLKYSLRVAEETEGSFDPTISPLVNAWGFGITERQKMTPERVDSLKALIGFQNISVEGNRVIKKIPGISFDFNAIAVGYATDLAGKLLESRGIKTYMIDLGGDLIARGLKPDGSAWRIGLEQPAVDRDAPQQWEYLVKMENRAVATSGNYRKYFVEDGKRYAHIIDPSTGFPVRHNLLSVAVFADNCITADAFSTAFMVMGFDKTLEFIKGRPDLEVFLTYSAPDGGFNTFASEGLNPIHKSELEQQ